MKTAKELDLRLVGKVIIFRDTHTNRTFLLYIDDDGGDGDEVVHLLLTVRDDDAEIYG